MNVNLQTQQSETLRFQNTNIQENGNNLPPAKAQVVISTVKTDKRIHIPGTSNTPKIIIDEEKLTDSFKEETIQRRTEPRRKEEKKHQEERREAPKKKKPKKHKKEQNIKQRPPVVGGCFHVFETLIFEVYKLLGGSLCDCVK